MASSSMRRGSAATPVDVSQEMPHEKSAKPQVMEIHEMGKDQPETAPAVAVDAEPRAGFHSIAIGTNARAREPYMIAIATHGSNTVEMHGDGRILIDGVECARLPADVYEPNADSNG